MQGAGTIGESLDLLAQQGGSAFADEIGFDLAANFLKARRTRRLHLRHLEDHVSRPEVRFFRRVLVAGFKDSIHEFGSVPQPGKRVRAADESGGDHLLAVLGCGLVQTGGAGLVLHSIGQVLCSLRSFLLRQYGLNLRLHLTERLKASILFVVHADDVKAVAAADHFAGAALGKTKGTMLHLANRTPLADPAERAAVLGAHPVFCVLLGSSREISARFQLLGNVFGFLFGSVNRLLVYLAVRRRGWSFYQDMADVHLFGAAVVVLMIAVVPLNIGGTDLYLAGYFGTVNQDVANLPLLRDGVGVHLLVAVVIGLELGFSRMNAFLDLISAKNSIFKLHLGVLFIKLPLNVGIRNRHRAGDQGFKLAHQQVVFYPILELGGSQIGFLEPPLISLLPDELAVREKSLTVAAVLQFVLKFG